jgi:FkbM family methyltransferase
VVDAPYSRGSVADRGVDLGLLSPLRRRRRLRRDLAALRTFGADDVRRRDFYAQFVRAGDLVFDVGANVGNRAKVFLALGARVVAVEPQRDCREVLSRGLGQHPGFVLEPVALGAAVRDSGRFARRAWRRHEQVPVTTLDALIARHGVPAFVKVDVEGYEAEVVAGLSRPLPALSLEYTPEHAAATHDALAHLRRLGALECNLSVGESMQLASATWLRGDGIEAALAHLPPTSFADVYVRMAPPAAPA